MAETAMVVVVVVDAEAKSWGYHGHACGCVSGCLTYD